MTAEFGNVEVVSIINRFFGETVTVAGLLTGRDVVEQLATRRLGDWVILPPAMFGGPEGQSLDGIWPQEIGEALGREVIVADGGFRTRIGGIGGSEEGIGRGAGFPACFGRQECLPHENVVQAF